MKKNNDEVKMVRNIVVALDNVLTQCLDKNLALQEEINSWLCFYKATLEDKRRWKKKMKKIIVLLAVFVVSYESVSVVPCKNGIETDGQTPACVQRSTIDFQEKYQDRLSAEAVGKLLQAQGAKGVKVSEVPEQMSQAQLDNAKKKMEKKVRK